MAGKNRTFRTDILTHPKTSGLHPLDRDILLTQVIASNIAGVLERSVAVIARTAGGGTKPAHVRASLKRLQERGVIRWWPEFECVWAIGSAGKQARSWKAWVAVKNVVEVLPEPVREAFADHYRDRYADTPSCPPPDGNHTREDRGQETEDRGQRTGESARAKPTPPKTRADIESELRGQAEHIVERIRWGEVPMPTPPGRRDALGFPTMNRERLVERLREGATADEVVGMFGKLSARITSGELPPEFWGGLALTGFYAPLRDGLPIPGKSKPGLAPTAGPRIESADEALAWARAHGNRMPDGWVWHDDGRGNHTAKRSRGGAA